jgi:hypothetical protein
VEAVPPSETNAGDPAHLKVSLQGGGAEIYVYPMAEYAAVDGAADYSIRLLKDILARGTPPSSPDDSPRVPFAHAGLPLAAKAEILPFRGGSGLRMVVQYASDVSPINNMGLLYQFMGLSRDGRYFVIVMCPLDLPFLAADGDPSGPVPPGGIPFPQQMSASAYEDYFRQVTELTERAPAALFDPSLDALDALVQSISTIAAPPYTPAGTPAP